jgi:ribosomal protein RSM22 (predicted rRNA methylase)
MRLPPGLQAIADDILNSSSTLAMARAAAAISARYRRESPGGPALLSDTEAKAYLATRFPATFAATAKAMDGFARAMPGFAPKRLLDLGAGPGTAALAASSLWPGLEAATLVETNTHMQALGRDLMARAAPGLSVSWRDNMSADGHYDLVTACYALNEMRGMEDAVRGLWRASSGVLLIVEPGTPAGQDIVLRARDILLEEGAHLAAPCPHEKECPLKGSEKWCHFSMRVERSRAHVALKQGAILGYEDEKFSYVAAARDKVIVPAMRVIGHPRGKKVMMVSVCASDGQAREMTAPKSSPLHAVLRKASWGDGIG